MAEDHQEALFQFSSPCALYYVQSPSTTSHANSHPSDSTFLSPCYPHETINDEPRQSRDETSRLVLSRYSSSRGSNNSFLHEKKLDYADHGQFKKGKRQVLRIVSRRGENDEEGESGGSRKKWIWRFVGLDPSSSGCCIVFQLGWRLAISVGFALLVFFLATRPRSPDISFKVGKMEQFHLREGLDDTGVITKILDCNCTILMQIENYSKVFGLHIHPPMLEMAFGRMTFARSLGEESYVEDRSSKTLRHFVIAKRKPVYAAGSSMQDMLESGQGLPIVVRVRSRSVYHIVWNLIRVTYHHRAECLFFLTRAYQTQIYNSTCTVHKFHA